MNEYVRNRLVDDGIVPRALMTRARADAGSPHQTELEALVAAGVDELALREALARICMVPICADSSLGIVSQRLSELVPADVAVEHRAVPVAFDADGSLRLAMEDPCDDRAVDELSFYAGTSIVREVATPTQIAAALHLPSPVPGLSARLREHDAAAPAREARASTETTALRLAEGSAPHALALTRLRARLTRAASDHDVADALLEYLGESCEEVVLCRIRHGALIPARGRRIAPEAMARTRLQLARPGTLARLGAAPGVFRGRLLDEPSTSFSRSLLGTDDVLAFSIPARHRVCAIALAAYPLIAPPEDDELATVASAVGRTLVNLRERRFATRGT